jgi:hypothetical protein
MTILIRCLRRLTRDVAASTSAMEYSAFGF